MSTHSFELIVSKPCTANEVQSVLIAILPGLRIDVVDALENVPEEWGNIVVHLKPTNDSYWPVAISFLCFPDSSAIGEQPALRLAEEFASRIGADVLTDLQGLFPEHDPHDPYYWLALVNGEWYLADAVDTPLMGPYSDGTKSFPGESKVKLVRLVDPWSIRGT
jgi:hypothetical protein